MNFLKYKIKNGENEEAMEKTKEERKRKKGEVGGRRENNRKCKSLEVTTAVCTCWVPSTALRGEHRVTTKLQSPL